MASRRRIPEKWVCYCGYEYATEAQAEACYAAHLKLLPPVLSRGDIVKFSAYDHDYLRDVKGEIIRSKGVEFERWYLIEEPDGSREWHMAAPHQCYQGIQIETRRVPKLV